MTENGESCAAYTPETHKADPTLICRKKSTVLLTRKTEDKQTHQQSTTQRSLGELSPDMTLKNTRARQPSALVDTLYFDAPGGEKIVFRNDREPESLCLLNKTSDRHHA